MSTKNDLTVVLGNRLKELRNKHNLTITGLAEILGISHSYVGFLEKGTRKGSEEVLKKYADFFQVSLDDLMELQSQIFDSSQIHILTDKSPTEEIVELNSLLLKLNEEIRISLIEKFKEQVQQTLYNLLTPYDVSDLKRNITKLKNSWFTENDSSIEEIEHQRGYISLPSGQVYFDLEVDKAVLHVQLLYEDRKQLSLFENWLGECSVTYATDENIQHVNEPQKVLQVLWFSPNMSYRDQYLLLSEKNLLSHELNYSDVKLDWYVHNFWDCYATLINLHGNSDSDYVFI